MYPTIALLAARAVKAAIEGRPNFPKQASFRWLPRRSASFIAILGVALALFELSLMLVNHHAWRDVERRKARWHFVDEVRAIVPAGTAIFAAPRLDDLELIVLAYRLGREIYP